MSSVIETTIAWRGRSIRLRYAPRHFTVVDRLEIESVDRAPLPITETGYEVRYPDACDPPMNEAELSELVIGWLDDEADTKAWRDAEEKRRQYSLL